MDEAKGFVRSFYFGQSEQNVRLAKNTKIVENGKEHWYKTAKSPKYTEKTEFIPIFTEYIIAQ